MKAASGSSDGYCLTDRLAGIHGGPAWTRHPPSPALPASDPCKVQDVSVVEPFATTVGASLAGCLAC